MTRTNFADEYQFVMHLTILENITAVLKVRYALVPAVLRKIAVGAFKCCQTSSQMIFIFEEIYAYSSLKIFVVLDKITNTIISKIGRKIFINFSEN